VAIALALQWMPSAPAHAASLPSDVSVAFQVNAAHSGGQADPIAPPLQRQWSIDLKATANYPVIAGGRLFVTAGPLLYAFDLLTGTQVWGPIDTGGRLAFPTYDGGRLFVQNANNFLRAIDPATGRTLWIDRLPNEISSDTPPVALNGTVYAVGQGFGGFLYAVRESDGSLLWDVDGSYPGAPEIGHHSSPVATNAGIYLDSSCGWNTDFDPATGNVIWSTQGACTTGAGVTPSLYQGRLYARDASSPTGQVLDATTGATLGSFESSQAPAFASSKGFFLISGQLVAKDLSTGSILWQFSGDGSLATAPIVANGNVYIGSSQGHLYSVDAATGAQTWTDPTALPPIAGEGTSDSVAGLAIGQGMLAVPAGSTLTVYGTGTPPGPPGPRPIPPQTLPPPTGSAGVQTSFQVDAVHDGRQSADTTTPPLAFAWARDFGNTPGTPLIAGGRAFVTANDAGGTNPMNLYAFDLQTGVTDWGPVALGPQTFPAGIAYDGGKLFVVTQTSISSGGRVQAFDPVTGQPLWMTSLTSQSFFSTAPVAANGAVYVVGEGSNATMYSLDETTGRVNWSVFVENAAVPAVTAGGIYVANGCMSFDLNPQTGAEIWRNTSICTGAGGGTAVAVSSGVYIPDGSIGNSIVNPQTGAVLGTYSADGNLAFYGSMGYFMGSMGYFPAQTRIWGEDLTTNTVDWAFDGDGSLVAGPIVVGGNVYVGSSSGNVYALRASDGTLTWSDNAKSAIAPSSDRSGLSAGGNMLLVPALNRLVAYRQCATPPSCASAPAPPPVVTRLFTGDNPPRGPAAGGTTVFITGSGFTDATGVSFGGFPASSFTVTNASYMTAVSPPGSGTVDVTVTNPAGTSPANTADQFIYVPAPVITALTPNRGPLAGGTRVTINGTHLGVAVRVWFGTNLATSLVVTSDTELQATSPPGAGIVDVTVSTSNGASSTSPADLFTYMPPAAPPNAPSSPTSLYRSTHQAPPPVGPCACAKPQPSRQAAVDRGQASSGLPASSTACASSTASASSAEPDIQRLLLAVVDLLFGLLP
jgi:outer membrane protein assembly factor BamB